MSHELPSFVTIEQALTLLEAPGGAAEAQGLLTALFCSDVAINVDAWVSSFLSQPIQQADIAKKDAAESCQQLFHATQASIRSDSYDFELLLPDDDESLTERIEALSLWCQGFLTGLNLMNIDVENQKAELQEAFDDLVKFACLQPGDEKDGDQEMETAYVELVEYTRTATQLVYSERTSMRKKKLAATVH